MQMLILIALGSFVVLRVVRELLGSVLATWGLLEIMDDKIQESQRIPDSPIVERARYWRRWWFEILWLVFTLLTWIGWIVFGR